ncbi:ABC transporter substrate-binding protein [Schlegelella sp. S2-27]|uniref:ABC transporter substrate-binding protein n=1 Tax=Caldimonas mangrovi TaxID=2944811 RepID=A0ABT0YMI4_9BURK|nr:ABC transporter substrate-binding protein [Caldimonas mangrovi]MCM5679944.1 ABC transporter substrate-binding protein [Caldimonas mangrovi]
MFDTLRACLRTLALLCVTGLSVPGLHAETGVSDTRIVIGQSAVFSGPARDFGVDYRAGIQLYLQRTNKQGGVFGRRIELVSHDDAYEPKRTADNTVTLIEQDRVFALIGYVATGNLIASLPIAEKAGVPMFAPMVGTTSFRTTHNRYLFHVRASYESELRKIIGHLATLGIHRIAAVYQDSAFGKSNLDTALKIAAGLNVQVVESVPLAIAATDAQPQVAALNKARPGAVLMIMAGRMVEVFIRDYRATGAAAPLYTISVGITDAPGSASRLQGGLQGVVTASIVPPPTLTRYAIVAEYQRDRAEFGEKIDSYNALEGYIVARVFVEGLRRAGRDLTRQGFIQAMERIGTFNIGDFPVTYGPGNHNGSHYVDLEMYLADGRLVR